MCTADFTDRSDEVGGGGSTQSGDWDQEANRMARLVRTIEAEIVPRMVVSRLSSSGLVVRAKSAEVFPGPLEISELVRLLLAHDASVARAYVVTVRQQGAKLEAILLELLAPAARELGVLWENDECDFMQVTVGLCRLHQVLRELSPEFCPDASRLNSERRILLVPCPGDQHTFGISLVAQFLQRANWDVWHEFPATRVEILDVARENWFTVVGLSVGSEGRLEELGSLIRAIRQFSRNKSVGILVGGPILVAHPEFAALIGADAIAANGPDAVVRADGLHARIGVFN